MPNESGPVARSTGGRRGGEAYWLGNRLLRTVDPAVFSAHLVDRLEARAGRGLADLTTLAHYGALAHHNFHVFAVYPWVCLG